ncbi:putative F-box domain-containing protein [Helianthus anomalus]
MSDNVPFEIQEELIKRLPVKSLIRFRSVSKSWKAVVVIVPISVVQYFRDNKTSRH